MHSLLSLDTGSLTFEQWIMLPMSFPNQFLWWNRQALASAPSEQTAASCNLHKVLFSFLWNAFPCSSPYNPFLIRIDNFYCDFSSSGLPCIMAILLQGSISPCSSEIAGTSPGAPWSEHEHGCVSFSWSWAHPGGCSCLCVGAVHVQSWETTEMSIPSFDRKAAFSRHEDDWLTDHTGNACSRSGFKLGLKLLLETHLKLHCRQGFGRYVTAHVLCASLERSPCRSHHTRMRGDLSSPHSHHCALPSPVLPCSTSGHHSWLTLLMLQFHRFLVCN